MGLPPLLAAKRATALWRKPVATARTTVAPWRVKGELARECAWIAAWIAAVPVKIPKVLLYSTCEDSKGSTAVSPEF